MDVHADYRSILKAELDARCGQNARYSLRAFARDLELSPSRLSEILNCKQGVSRRVAEKIAGKLGFQGQEAEYFCDLVSVKHARSVRERQEARLRLLKSQAEREEESKTFQLKLDAFKIISDWHHIGLLELMNMKGFRNDTRWIARRLGVTPIQIEVAIERLLRVGLLRKDPGGALEAVENDGWIPGGVPSESIRKFHRQVLQKAMDAIGTQSLDQRYVQTHLLALDRKDVGEAFKEIQAFQRGFCNKFKGEQQKDFVYCISMQLFKIAEDGP